MAMTPGWRRFALTCHVVSSVGWAGAVIVFLALGVIAMTARDIGAARAVYLVLEPAGWAALVPLAVASLVTGLIQALGSTWGLLRHYWIIFKLVINLAAVGVLLLYMQTLGLLAQTARTATLTADDEALLRSPSVVLHSALALVLLLAATVLAIYKPRAMTSYGRRKLAARRPAAIVPAP